MQFYSFYINQIAVINIYTSVEQKKLLRKKMKNFQIQLVAKQIK